MNVFATMLHGHPEVVDALADRAGETASFEDVLAVIEGREFPLVLDRGIGETLMGQEPFGPLLAEGYLPIIETGQWKESVQGAEDLDEHQDGEWVTFAKGERQSRGVSAPDDSNAWSQVSLFTRVGGRVCRVAIDYPTAGRPPSGISVTAPIGCSLPDWGRCADNECDGDCRLIRRPTVESFFCRCPHL